MRMRPRASSVGETAVKVAIIGVPFIRQPGVFAGATVAGVRWVQALLEGGIHCDLYAQGSSLESVRAAADAMYRGHGSYRLRALEELPGELRRDSYFAVHDPEGLNRVDALLALARRSRASAAVTAAQYAVPFPQVQVACVRLAALPTLGGWGVLCLSSASMEAQRKMFNRWGVSGGRLAIVPGCVNVKEFRRTDRKAARARYGVGTREVVILYVGRLTSHDKVDFGTLLWLVREVQRRKGGSGEVHNWWERSSWL